MKKEKKICIINAGEHLCRENYGYFRKAVLNSINNDFEQIYINMRETKYVSTSFFSFLSEVEKELEKGEGAIVLNPSWQVTEVLEIMGYEDRFTLEYGRKKD